MLGALADRARLAPDDLAVTDGRCTLSWAALARDVDRAGAAMLSVATEVDDRVAVLGDNAVATLVVHAAGLCAGVGTTATSRQLTSAEMCDQWSGCGVVAAVAGPGSVDAAAAAASELQLRSLVVHGTVAPPGAIGWQRWLDDSRGGLDSTGRPPRPLLVYTSGTTGRPRGAEVRWTKTAVQTSDEYLHAITSESRFPAGAHLVVGPLQHNAPLTALRHLLSGQPVVILPRFDAEAVLAEIETHHVTSTTMVPTHFQRLLALDPAVRARYDVSSLQLINQTGAACPADVKLAMIEWFGPILVESYGGSEVGTVSRIDATEWLAHRGSVGRARPPFEVIVVGTDGEVVGAGEVGILGFRAPAEHAIRYHDDEAKTAAAYVLPGVFTLGDVGYIDDDGFIFITDRVADMVVSGGVNLYPAESERVLMQHLDVADIAVIGVPDEDMGEALHALVVVAGDHLPSGTELQSFCREHLAAYKCPRTYEFVDELPRNVMGKVDKVTLRGPYWQTGRAIAG